SKNPNRRYTEQKRRRQSESYLFLISNQRRTEAYIASSKTQRFASQGARFWRRPESNSPCGLTHPKLEWAGRPGYWAWVIRP
ncbi:hypothetical protein LINGRAHAP2_LOCUS7222, partial [Linum grandiflorum]